MRLTKGGEADAADAAAATTAASTASAATAASTDQEKWFWHADSKPVYLSLFLPFLSSTLIMQLHHPLSPTTHPFFATLCKVFCTRMLARTEIRDVSRL